MSSNGGHSERTHPIKFTLDGVEAEANDGDLLIEAAKMADVEIPYFCYEPKLGPPVGACRMCLVEIEGIPKLQTACSTPVKDGMVVNTRSAEVKEAQESVVEFLLVNHPLDCPVCDKGGECPLQDITMGWGPGRSRMSDPKRHFVKPVELSPLIAIDRERCILCYRCVRYSQEVTEDDQLALLGRGAETFVGTFGGSKYVAPFSGNVIELCPVGALTSTAYRFNARPWDNESSASVCSLCPSQCNVNFTVRDEKVVRVTARDNYEVDNGWLCDKGRFGYQSIYSPKRITEPLVREAGLLCPASWDEAIDTAASALGSAGKQSAALVGGETTNEEGFLLQRLFRNGLGSDSIDARRRSVVEPDIALKLASPPLQASMCDIDSATTIVVLDCDPIDQMAILDLRIRKAVRHGRAKLAVVSSRAGALDGGASERVSHLPGRGEAVVAALIKAILVYAEQEQTLGEPVGVDRLKSFYANQSLEALAQVAGADPQTIRDTAVALFESPNAVVIWGEELIAGPRSSQTLKNLLNLALLLRLDESEHGGLLEISEGANGRGLREVGCVPNLKPGLVKCDKIGLTATEIAGAATSGEVEALYLLHTDPSVDHHDRSNWIEALKRSTVIAHAQFLSKELERHADVVFPAESYAEKQGTLTHPDGRLQRLRAAIPRPDQVKMEWQILVELCERLGGGVAAKTAEDVFEFVCREVGLYRGLTLAELTSKGKRWYEGGAVTELEWPDLELFDSESPDPRSEEGIVLSSYRPIWASAVTNNAEKLEFLSPRQCLQIAASDAERLGLTHGDSVEVRSNGHSVQAAVALVRGATPGAAYLIEGTDLQPANLVAKATPGLAQIKKVEGAEQ